MENEINNIVENFCKEHDKNWYHFYIHLLNLVCVAKDKFDERESHDLFHSVICFNKLAPEKYHIDWEWFYA